MSRRTRILWSSCDERESALTSRIREYLVGLGLKPFRADQGRARRTDGTGLPDLFTVLPGGQLLGIETKRPTARPRANEARQREVLAWLREQGACVITARELVDVAQVINLGVLQRLRNAHAAGAPEQIESPAVDTAPRLERKLELLRLGRNQREMFTREVS